MTNQGTDTGDGRAETGSTERLWQHARAMRSDGDALARSAEAATAELGALAREQLERSPYVTLGAAFAAGWLVGGGLSARFATLLAGAGTRVALATLSRSLLGAVGGGGASEARAGADAPDLDV